MEATLPIFDIFAKRKRKAEQGDQPVVFQIDTRRQTPISL